VNPTFDADLGPLWPYLFVVIAGFLATEVWRWVGVLVGTRLDESSPVIGWVRAVATALVAGVIAKLLLSPGGALGATPMLLRIAAAAVGFVAYMVGGQRLFVGIAAAEAALVAGWLALMHA
jgi:hypothetical protein